MWRRRVRQVQFWRVSPVLLILLGIETVTSWLTMTIDTQPIGLLVPGMEPLFRLMLDWIILTGFGIIAMLVLWVYVYLLIAFQFLLPGWAALLASAGLFIVDRLTHFKFELLKLAQWLQPPALRPIYESFVEWVGPALAVLGVIATGLITCLGLYVQLRMTHGLLTMGSAFRDEEFYRNWTKAAEPIITRQLLSEAVCKLWRRPLEASRESDLGRTVPPPATGTGANSIKPTAHRKRQRRLQRRQKRASRRKNRR